MKVWKKLNRRSPNEAVLRDGGSNSAEKAALNCKFTARSKFSVSRHLAKPLGRYLQCAGDSTDKQRNIKSK
jgi:hypothetical protein